MKILVVEDDTEKLRNVVGALVEIEGIVFENIAQVSDAVRAKQHLRNHAVDLIVLDLHLPDRIDLPPRPNGGLEFIRSISNRPGFYVPAHVVALSGNAEAVAQSSQHAGEIWGVIRYDATSNDWRHAIQARIKYALSAWNSMVSRDKQPRRCHVAIVTALNDELAGVLRLPVKWQEYNPTGDGTTYYEGSVVTEKGEIFLSAATAGRMGMAATSALASKMIDIYRPKVMCMAGITGGIKGRVNLGDIIVADPSWDWGSGKYEVVDGKPRFSASPEQLRISPDLRGKLLSASQNEERLSRIRSSFPGSKPDSILHCHVEAVASGAAVLGDAAVVESIKQQHRKLHGVEMEIYGLMMAAEICTQPRPVVFGAKAVSDFADPLKADDLRAFAIHASTNFIFEFIKDSLRLEAGLP